MKNLLNLYNSLAHNKLACPFDRIAVGCDLKDRWRSWLARLHDTEEVTGSSPVRFILFFAFIPPFQSCERGIARIGKSNFYGEINLGSNNFGIVDVNAAGRMSERRTRKTMLVFVAVSVARICLRLQPLESSLGRVPQAADFTCNKISQIGSCRSPRTV